MRIALLTPPGITKHQIPEKLAEHFQLPIISLKSLLLREVNSGSDLGFDIKKQVDNSKPVSNENIISVMNRNFEEQHDDYQDGFLLDGMPCNGVQATALDKVLAKDGQKLDGVVFLQIHYDRLMEFLTGQLICRSCEAEFNIYFKPPHIDKTCDQCGSRLYIRTDDREETIGRRIRDFELYLNDLEAHFDDDCLHKINSGIDLEEVYKACRAKINAIKKSLK